MKSVDQTNTLIDAEEAFYEEYDFEFDFINMPWGIRGTKSKIAIITLLVSIFVATMALVINNFAMHSGSTKTKMTAFHLDSPNEYCHLVRVEDYRYAARIHSKNTRELICVGAVVSENTVLANGACLRNRQVRLYVGSSSDSRCRLGFTVYTVETITHEGVLTQKLVLLITNENMLRCAKVIQLGTDMIDNTSIAYVIGRSLKGGITDTFLTKQIVNVVGMNTNCSCQGLPKQHQPNIICVKTIGKCPILAGNLLVQGGMLYGLASTSLYRPDQVEHTCFADLKVMKKMFSDYEKK